MDKEYKTETLLDAQMRSLLSEIEKEPVPDELRSLAAELQKLLDARRIAETDKA